MDETANTDPNEEEGSGDVRGDLAGALAGKLTPRQIELLLNEVLAITKNVQADFKCKKCGAAQRQLGTVNDAAAVTRALVELMNQSWGRPTESKVETEIIVNRTVVLVADTEEEPDGIAGDAEPV